VGVVERSESLNEDLKMTIPTILASSSNLILIFGTLEELEEF